MSYDVIRHADTKRREVIKFMKVIPGAVYFKSVNGNLQVVSSFRDSLDSEHANGRDIYNHLRKDTVGHGYKITTDELLKAARAYIDQFSSVKHSDDDPDVLTEDEIEIIDAPYPKDPQMPRGNAAMRPFDYEDTGVYPRDYTEGSLQHHGVKGMRWGVINEDDPKGRSRSSSSGSNSGGSSRGSQSSGGHPYYSPSVGDASSHHSVKKDKSGVSGPTNTSVSNSKKRTTPTFSKPAYSDSNGVHCPVSFGNTGYATDFNIQGRVLTSLLDRDEDVLSYVKQEVYSQISGLSRLGEPYKRAYFTDKQIDMVVWRLMYEINNWKKNYYKPGVYHSNFIVIREGDDYLSHHGILGQKWGVRRYQNADGSLTEAGRKHYGRNYTVRELKKNIQDPNLSYSEKKALVSANKVNRMVKTKYRDASTNVATAATGLAGAGTLAGLMAAGVLSVNPLLPVAALAGGVAAGKVMNAGRHFVNNFRDIRVEMLDRKIDKERDQSPKKPITYAYVAEAAKNEAKLAKAEGNGMYMVTKQGELGKETLVTGKEAEEFWKALAKQYEEEAKKEKK